jgi:glutamate racemase
LSVLRELQRLLPHERFVFVADQRHVPYGEKTAAELRRYTAAITRFLLSHRCKIVVVACNTGTVYAIKHLRATFPVPFVGTVPAIKPAAARSRSRVVAILSTPATAASPALKRLVRDHAADVRVLCIGCPGLEESVERGIVSGPELDSALRSYLRPARRAGADVVVLGCTHYPFIGRRIAALSNARVIDSGRAIARQTARLLTQAGLLRQHGRGGVLWYTNGSPAAFSRVASTLLRTPVRARRARC